MSDNYKSLVLNGREFFLLGTAHVSRESISDVEREIETQKPDCVAIELDEQRYASLKNPESWRNLDIVKVLKEKRGWVLLANLVLGSYQKRMGEDTGVQPGEEMKIAAEKANSLGIPIALVDRPIQTTLRRAWAKNSFFGKCKLLAVLFSSIFEKENISSEQIEELKNSNEMDSMMAELAEYFPAVKQVLIDERDLFLASSIWHSKGNKVLAVLGAGHLPGVERWLKQFAEDASLSDVSNINEVPKAKFFTKLIAWAIPLAILALIVAGFFKGGASTSIDMLLQWWLVNGTLAALGTIIARGHIASILVSFCGAWLTSLNPFIGIGVVAGLVQASVCKPKVHDMEFLREDATSVKGFYKNRILRVLLVFLLSSVGSSIGTFVAFPALVRILVI